MEGSVTAALLEEYSMSRSEAVRNEIVLKNLGLVRSCALSLRNTYIKYGEVGDVVNEGVIALMDAIETYDPSRGAKFETYASLKIRGAIIDYVRKQDWVPRPVRKFARDLDNANTILYNQYDRAPTTAELAEYLQISEESCCAAWRTLQIPLRSHLRSCCTRIISTTAALPLLNPPIPGSCVRNSARSSPEQSRVSRRRSGRL